jgi:hypothetical protein
MPARSLLIALLAAGACAAEPAAPDEADARAALRRAVAFFRTAVAVEGGYVWRYSADLARRAGEHKVEHATIWVQPPGTPTVGQALLDAYELTGEPDCLDAARAAGQALLRGQLVSGGWTAFIPFDAARRRPWAFRVDGAAAGTRDLSSLDDDTTQSALRFLMQLDRALKFADRDIHAAAELALRGLLTAQFDNGGWPQAFPRPAHAAISADARAAIPSDWPRTFPGEDEYWFRPTLNDGVMADVIRTLFAAAQVYGDERYRAAAERGGRFLLRAQLPEPQPGWAQQYDFAMRPCWARRFEPPAISGGEARGVLRTLLDLYERTGDRRWLAPIPRALAYYRSLRLPDGRLARFYELGTGRPLYLTRAYELTHSDADLPTHYAFKVNDWTDGVAARYERLARLDAAALARLRAPAPPRLTPRLTAAAAEAIATLDDRGAWVTAGRLQAHGPDDDTRQIIETTVFCERLRSLARYIAASQAE